MFFEGVEDDEDDEVEYTDFSASLEMTCGFLVFVYAVGVALRAQQ